MKIFFLFTFLTLASVAGFSQSEEYVTEMKALIAKIDTSFKNPSNLLDLADEFEHVAIEAKNQWLPYYYAAFCEVNYGFMEQDKDKVDGIADKATALLANADVLVPDNSEISCIKSMIASCHMMVNPMQRWQEYGAESNGNMEKAMQEDSANPRPYYLKGQGLKYTPEQFGGGCKTALSVLQTALDKYSAFIPASELHPTWGLEQVKTLIKGCR